MEAIKLTGLWKSKDKNGNTYLSGSLNRGVKVMIFKNDYKKKEDQPDYNLYIQKKESKEDQENNFSQGDNNEL